MADRNDTCEVEEVVEEVVQKKSLGDLLEIMRRADDDLENYEIDLDELGVDIRNKVDAITEYLFHCRERADGLKKVIEVFKKKATAFENKYKNLKLYVANQLVLDAEQKGLILGNKDCKPRLTGHLFQFTLGHAESVEVLCEPNASIYLKVGEKYCSRSYKWDKRALKAALDRNDPLIMQYAEKKRTAHVKIDARS